MSTDALGSVSTFGRLAPTRGLGSISIARAAHASVCGVSPPESGIWGGGAAVWALGKEKGYCDPRLLLGAVPLNVLVPFVIENMRLIRQIASQIWVWSNYADHSIPRTADISVRIHEICCQIFPDSKYRAIHWMAVLSCGTAIT